MRKDIQEANTEVEIRREEVHKVHFELAAIKKENQDLKRRLKMYREMVKDLQAKHKLSQTQNEIET